MATGFFHTKAEAKRRAKAALRWHVSNRLRRRNAVARALHRASTEEFVLTWKDFVPAAEVALRALEEIG